ncbi:MAG: DUF1311 domain-containing protein [Cyanothece sp. SIO1E1]|nr:DUF1311 domain-containing protein [Cyanothece sp. SIO1E1]
MFSQLPRQFFLGQFFLGPFFLGPFFLSAIAPFILLAAPGLANSSQLIAQASEPNTEPTIDCNNPQGSIETRQCAEQAYDEANNFMAEVYQKLLNVLEDDSRSRLIKSQLAWIEFRDSDCAFAVFEFNPTSPLEQQTRFDQCREQLTVERAADLESDLNFLASVGNPRPDDTPENTERPIPVLLVASLPDGNFRYTSVQHETSVVSDEELIEAGGALFWFRKKGDIVTGSFGLIDNESICIRGQVTGNTIAGFAIQDSTSVLSDNEEFVAWDPNEYLTVRRGQRTGRQVRYESALLNLNGFHLINAGSKVPPCQ